MHKTETWNAKTGESVKIPNNVIDFYNDLIAVFKKHNLSISHEDYHGSFLVENYNEQNIEWLKNAGLNID